MELDLLNRPDSTSLPARSCAQQTFAPNAASAHTTTTTTTMDHLHAGFQMSMAPPLMNQPPQIFGGYSDHGLSTSQLPPDMLSAHMFADHGMMDDTNEAKRRRIARVSWTGPGATGRVCQCLLMTRDAEPPGLRHVPQEEDQVRRQAPGLHALRQLQDGVHLHPGREEEESAQGVGLLAT